MKHTADTSVADSFSSLSGDEETGLSLSNGSRVAVVGGGPSGSFSPIMKRLDSLDTDG